MSRDWDNKDEDSVLSFERLTGYLIDRLVLTALVEVLVRYWGTQRRQ